MKKLKKIDNSCAVVALHHVSGIDEETVLRVCVLHDFNCKDGMEDEDWREAAKELGIKVVSIPLTPCRLKKFLKEFPTGLFLVGTRDHLFVIDNGIIVDPSERQAGRYPGLGRIIKQAWRVSNICN